MDGSNEEQQRLVRIQMYQIVVPIFVVISCLGVLANAIVVFALRATKVRNATVTLILSLTISDIWTSSVVALSLLYNSYLPTVKGTQVNLCFSLTLEMMRTGGLITGILHLLLISIHHYIGIVRPYTSKTHLKSVAQCLCGLAWLLPSLTLFVLALAFPAEGFWNCEHVSFYYTRAFRWSVSGMLTSIFIIITSAYIRLLRLLRKQRKKWPSQRLYSVDVSYSPTAKKETKQRNTKMRSLRASATNKSGDSVVKQWTRCSVPILYARAESYAATPSTAEKETLSLYQLSDASSSCAQWEPLRNCATTTNAATAKNGVMHKADDAESSSANRDETAKEKSDKRETEVTPLGVAPVSEKMTRQKSSENGGVSFNSATRWQSDWKPPSEWNMKVVALSSSEMLNSNSSTEVCSSCCVASATTPNNYTDASAAAAASEAFGKRKAAVEKRAARENRTLWTTILICSSFFLGWAPATILFTLTCDTCALRYGNPNFLFAFSCTQLCFILAKSLVNPLIYSLRIPEVDSQIRSVLQQLCWRARKLSKWLVERDKKLTMKHEFRSQKQRTRSNHNALEALIE